MTDQEVTPYQQLRTQQAEVGIGGIAALEFTQVDTFPAFRAEWALKGDRSQDYVVHFFLKEGQSLRDRAVREFWTGLFPTYLSDTAMSFFGKSHPQLEAAYTQEVDSWWLSAKDCAETAFPDKYIELFFRTLDAACRPGRG